MGSFLLPIEGSPARLQYSVFGPNIHRSKDGDYGFCSIFAPQPTHMGASYK